MHHQNSIDEELKGRFNMTEERNTERRYKPKKKLRKGRVFLTVLLLAGLTIGIYSFLQYREGYNLANETKVKQDIDFEGDAWSKGERENILVLGADSGAGGKERSRTDTMMIISWDKEKNDVKVISFMRDIYADIPNYKSYKLNTAYYLDGVPLLQATLQNMFDIPIHHYALIDFRSFESLVDILAPEGITMDVEKDMSEKIGVSLTKGKQQLNGQEILGYARFRADGEGDFGRVARQQKVMEALKDEVISIQNVSNVPKFIGAAEGYIQTDYSRKDKVIRVMDAIVSGKLEMDKMTVPVPGSYYDKNYSHAGDVLVIDEDQNRKAIEDFLGE